MGNKLPKLRRPGSAPNHKEENNKEENKENIEKPPEQQQQQEEEEPAQNDQVGREMEGEKGGGSIQR